MTMKQFMKDHRPAIDSYILRMVPGARLNDKERRLWILNDEILYRWARKEGVRI